METLQGRAVSAIFAHLDDETFAIGGTIAHYAKLGVRWDLFCATDGDAGRSAVPVSSKAELAALRRNELISAARLLGVRGEIVARGYPDGELAHVEPDQLVGDVVELLRDVKPDVVITFGPEGAPNTHRDHRAISRAATAAFYLAALPTAYPEQQRPTHAAARLFYCTWPSPGAGSPYTVYGVPATARIDVQRELETKRHAFLVHATQRELMDRFELLALTDGEWYALAGGRPQPGEPITDLFDGL
jgi:N-acetylglucosamine malate deacetylase 2